MFSFQTWAQLQFESVKLSVEVLIHYNISVNTLLLTKSYRINNFDSQNKRLSDKCIGTYGPITSF